MALLELTGGYITSIKLRYVPAIPGHVGAGFQMTGA